MAIHLHIKHETCSFSLFTMGFHIPVQAISIIEHQKKMPIFVFREFLPRGLEHLLPCTSPMERQYRVQQPFLRPKWHIYGLEHREILLVAHTHSQSDHKTTQLSNVVHYKLIPKN